MWVYDFQTEKSVNWAESNRREFKVENVTTISLEKKQEKEKAEAIKREISNGVLFFDSETVN